MKRYCLTLDLKADPELIRQYEEHHQAVWPEIISSIKDAGISNMEIYRHATRLLMIMDVNDEFSFEHKKELDASNQTVNEWEQLMWRYQQPLAGAEKGQKWQLMNKIFELKES